MSPAHNMHRIDLDNKKKKKKRLVRSTLYDFQATNNRVTYRPHIEFKNTPLWKRLGPVSHTSQGVHQWFTKKFRLTAQICHGPSFIVTAYEWLMILYRLLRVISWGNLHTVQATYRRDLRKGLIGRHGSP